MNYEGNNLWEIKQKHPTRYIGNMIYLADRVSTES